MNEITMKMQADQLIRMSQLILIAVDLTVIFLDLLCLFLKLFEVHLRGILLDVLSTELLLEFVYRVT